ncbi:MAG: hypothetical protein MHPSP_002324, partial [Paramarteilia canceri]
NTLKLGGAESCTLIKNNVEKFELIEDSIIVFDQRNISDFQEWIKPYAVFDNFIGSYLLYGADNILEFVAFPNVCKISIETSEIYLKPEIEVDDEMNDNSETNDFQIKSEKKVLDMNLKSSLQNNNTILFDFLNKFVPQNYTFSDDTLVGILEMLFSFSIQEDLISPACQIVHDSLGEKIENNQMTEVLGLIRKATLVCDMNLLTLFSVPLEDFKKDKNSAYYILNLFVFLLDKQYSSSMARDSQDSLIEKIFTEKTESGLNFREVYYKNYVLKLLQMTTCEDDKFQQLCLRMLKICSNIYKKYHNENECCKFFEDILKTFKNQLLQSKNSADKTESNLNKLKMWIEIEVNI